MPSPRSPIPSWKPGRSCPMTRQHDWGFTPVKRLRTMCRGEITYKLITARLRFGTPRYRQSIKQPGRQSFPRKRENPSRRTHGLCTHMVLVYGLARKQVSKGTVGLHSLETTVKWTADSVDLCDALLGHMGLSTIPTDPNPRSHELRSCLGVPTPSLPILFWGYRLTLQDKLTIHSMGLLSAARSVRCMSGWAPQGSLGEVFANCRKSDPDRR